MLARASETQPLQLLEAWLQEAAEAGVAEPGAVTFITATENGRPSARTVLLKRLEDEALIFTSALWTRKASELQANPNVALLFYWPTLGPQTLGRQVHVTGHASIADRQLAGELFAERDLSRQVQTLVSRQGEPIEEIQSLRDRHAHLMEAMEAPPACPPDWGAIRVVPETVEFWREAADRMHERLLYVREGEVWRMTRLAP